MPRDYCFASSFGEMSVLTVDNFNKNQKKIFAKKAKAITISSTNNLKNIVNILNFNIYYSIKD